MAGVLGALGLGLSLGLLWIPWQQISYGTGPDLGGLFAALGALILLWSLRPRFAKKDAGEDEPVLNPDEFPELHAYVKEIAQRANVPAPDRIFLFSTMGASTWRRRRWYQLQAKATVGIGLPMFFALSPEELGAVIAHELGHHAGRDLLMGAWVYRTRQSIGAALESLEDSPFFLDLPFRAYAALFLRVSAAVSREQELAADALSAATCGAEVAASALDITHRLQMPWDVYLRGVLVPAINTGTRLPVLEGFERFLSEKELRDDFRELCAEETEPSPWDTHPVLEERLSALQARPPRTRTEQTSLSLLGGAERAEDAWYARFTQGEVVRCEWNELGMKRVLPRLKESVKELKSDPERTPLSNFRELARNTIWPWKTPRNQEVIILSPSAQRQTANKAWSQWLTVALAARGFTVESPPGAELRVRRGNTCVFPFKLTDQLVQGQLSEEAFAQLAAEWENSEPGDVEKSEAAPTLR